MGRKRKQRRQTHGSAWLWKQTDCWYFTLPGTKKRIPLFDDQGQRIRGKDRREAAETALAKVKVATDSGNDGNVNRQRWLVAKVCSEYLLYCQRGVANRTISEGHHAAATSWLNDFCGYCGALAVAELKKGHIKTWIDNHPTWRSPATHRSAIAVVLAAFNYAESLFDIPNPLKGLKKPASQPRLQSFTPEDEESLYGACEERFRDFLFADIHTGLRPYCELARITADDVEENTRGMMWRVYSSKTKKTRKIPVRPEVAELTRKLMKSAPRGSGLPLFRNTQGKPWKRMTGVVRFLDLKKKLRWDKDPAKTKYSSYTCRHTFAHRMLSGYWNDGVGCSIEVLAELIGDTPKVAFDHYGKEWGQHYQNPLWAAIGGGAQANAVPPQSSAGQADGAKSRPKPPKRKSTPNSRSAEAKPKHREVKG